MTPLQRDQMDRKLFEQDVRLAGQSRQIIAQAMKRPRIPVTFIPWRPE